MASRDLPPDPYEALGITRDADIDQIKKAHRKLVLKYHPDRVKDPALIQENREKFLLVQQAYELLADPTRRQRYDDQVKLAQARKERMAEGKQTEDTKPSNHEAYSTPVRTSYAYSEEQPRPRFVYPSIYRERYSESDWSERSSESWRHPEVPSRWDS